MTNWIFCLFAKKNNNLNNQQKRMISNLKFENDFNKI